MDEQQITAMFHGMRVEGPQGAEALLAWCTERNDQIRILKAESAQLAMDLANEQAISARFRGVRDAGISVVLKQMTRLTAVLAQEQATVARLSRDRAQQVGPSRQHVALSSTLGDYTSQFLDAKSASDRAALLTSIRNATPTILGGGASDCDRITILLRIMMGKYGFVFREPAEGQREWAGHVTIVPLVTFEEVLDGLVKARLESLGSRQLYLLELIRVVLRVAEYLEANP